MLEQDYYRLEEVAEEWDCSVDALMDAAIKNEITMSAWVGNFINAPEDFEEGIYNLPSSEIQKLRSTQVLTETWIGFFRFIDRGTHKEIVPGGYDAENLNIKIENLLISREEKSKAEIRYRQLDEIEKLDLSAKNHNNGVKKFILQEMAIMEWFKDHKEDPFKIPPYKPGQRNVKGEVERDMLKNHALFTARSFNKAWERLRNQKRISNS